MEAKKIDRDLHKSKALLSDKTRQLGGRKLGLCTIRNNYMNGQKQMEEIK